MARADGVSGGDSGCGCGCSQMTSVTEATDPCACGCACCEDDKPRTRDQEIAELVRLKESIDRRLGQLAS